MFINIIKHKFPSVYYRLRKLKYYCKYFIQRYFIMKYSKPLPIFSITDKLIEYIENNDNVFFIQIGANDGINDPDNGYFDP